ncbi:MAG: DnaA regulatory inactivator Hda [Reinekea sp.]|jgi:DnaA-homolog protein
MSKVVSRQLPLHISFREDAVFEDYLPANNAIAVGTLRQALVRLDDHLIYLWGASGVGISHLLQAAVHDLQSQTLNAIYLPLGECIDYGPEALEGLDEMDAVALDDIDALIGHAHWQEAIFHFYNRMRDSGRMILVGGSCSPLHLGLSLADLKSRLSSGLTLNLVQMDDEQRTDWVIWKGRKRGLVITPEVAEFLINRHNRNMRELVATFDQIDAASLAEKRKITIPFLKQVLGL